MSLPTYIDEFWTAKQRQAAAIHEISYRACFKPQLPRFFINKFTEAGDKVYDPFSGRGTTAVEAALLGRQVVANDINPLSLILLKPRLAIPLLEDIIARINEIKIIGDARADMDLSMFYHPSTEAEIVSIKNYFTVKQRNNTFDDVDAWIRMVATNRLTGHSSGFFSVYTLPPNQAVSPERQQKINNKRNQRPTYRNTKEIILKKTRSLLNRLSSDDIQSLSQAGKKALYLNSDARQTLAIENDSIQLTVTSPPFLDVVQYSSDNWLRCWFNGIDHVMIGKSITMARTIDDWCTVMEDVFKELYRITRTGGYVAFEVGEVKKGSVKLEDYVVPLGAKVGFKPECIYINEQNFTKTSNIWGVKNNSSGTNTNRIALFKK